MTFALTNAIKPLMLLIPVLLCFGFAASVRAHDAAPHAHENPKAEVTHLNAAEAKALLEQRPEVQVLDVRTRREFKHAHIQDAIQINYFSRSFKKKLRKLDRNAPYLVHCKTGHRSGGAVKVMQREGFQNIYHLDGGFKAWQKLSAQPQTP